MFLQKPSPFTLKVKSRIAEILLLRKNDAIIISKAFPNIWKRIYNKSYHNMVSIKEATFKKIIILIFIIRQIKLLIFLILMQL